MIDYSDLIARQDMGASAEADRAVVNGAGQAVSAVPASVPSACRNCDGGEWVCENHADRPWDGTSKREDACGCGAGVPCRVCQVEAANAPLIYSIAQEARRYAGFYRAGSDARHTFEMFAEFVETRAIAQAIKARSGTAAPEDGGDHYSELLFAVERKFPGETRHATALRYIREREANSAQGIEARSAETAGLGSREPGGDSHAPDPGPLTNQDGGGKL